MSIRPTLVLFGAGKIGRSFIAQLFCRAGWETVFVDVVPEVVEALNIRGAYDVIIKHPDGRDEVLPVEHVRAVSGMNPEAIADEIASATLLATSVGPAALPKVIPAIAEGLMRREASGQCEPIDIILAENLRDAAEFVRGHLQRILPPDYPLAERVGLVETSIGKMVPIMPMHEAARDPLKVYAEPYNTLILDRRAFRNPVPEVPGLAPKENMKAWCDRKSFIHNLGHAAAAYAGQRLLPGAVCLWELLESDALHAYVRATMLEAGQILRARHPGEFSENDVTDHVDDLLARFRNRALGDTVFRVGRDLPRKLGPEDRLVGAIQAGIRCGRAVDRILFALACGLCFDAVDEEGKPDPADARLLALLEESGATGVLQSVCHLDDDTAARVVAMYETVRSTEAESFELLLREME